MRRLVNLQDGFLFGQFVRSIHFWSANLLVVVVCLHGLRVFFTGGFHPPRRLNWVVGLGLLILLLASNLTGYLLPWDQLAYWATIICVSMLEYIPVIGSRLQQIVLGWPPDRAGHPAQFFCDAHRRLSGPDRHADDVSFLAGAKSRWTGDPAIPG